MKLYTKTGDDGDTGLIGGNRVSKDDPRVAAYGEVDELNASIGAVVAACRDHATAERLRHIQSDLFILGAQLADPSGDRPPKLQTADVERLETWIDDASANAPPLRQFVLPGGTETAARLHVARAVCRRAERSVVALSRQVTIDRHTIVYLNRLADLLFALARADNHSSGTSDIPWIAPESR